MVVSKQLCIRGGLPVFDGFLPPDNSTVSTRARLAVSPFSFQLADFQDILPSDRSWRHTIESPAQLRAGTSGYAYKEWKGSFYPEKLPDRDMLRFYSQHFSTVEINHSFYRMPTERLLVQWAECVPGGFRFALKANQQITHIQKLRNCESTLKRFLEAASILSDGDHLGPILVQLPPTFRADLNVLEEFLKLRPRAFRFALEVRHSSWHSDETYALLRQCQTALCLAETEKESPPEVLTADFVYVRLRRETYTPKQLSAWRARFDSWLRQGIDAYVYCKHEDAGKAPAYARSLLTQTPGPRTARSEA